MDSIRVRTYKPSDRPEIMELVPRFSGFDLPPWRTATDVDSTNARTLASALDDRPEGSTVLVAEVDGSFAGFVRLGVTVDHFSGARVGYVSDIAVHPDFEGRGVASALVAEAERWALAEGFSELTLYVFDANTRAKRFYEKHGFAPDIVQFTKRLRPR